MPAGDPREAAMVYPGWLFAEGVAQAGGWPECLPSRFPLLGAFDCHGVQAAAGEAGLGLEALRPVTPRSTENSKNKLVIRHRRNRPHGDEFWLGSVSSTVPE